MIYLIGLVLLILLAFGPQLWVRHILAKHSVPRDDFPGTGGELAEHLVDHYELNRVTVVPTDEGDHYDPTRKTIGLTKPVMEGRSLTAVVTAAHEVGHAIQDKSSYPPLVARTRMARTAMIVEKLGAGLIMAAPLVAILLKAPSAGLATFVGAILVMGMSVAVHLVTLPVEFDASFGKALPILQQGGYLSEGDMPAARQILRACALTYVAASLASLLNIGRWIAILRR